MIGIALSNTSPLVAPTRARVPLIGTNPIAIAAPAGRFGAFCLDMATSTIPRGRIEVAARRGESLPIGWAIDADGRPATTPEAALGGALHPLGGEEATGGHKGYGLSLAVDLLTGVLAGAAFGPNILGLFSTEGRSDLGQTFIAIDPAAVDTPGAFERRLEGYLEQLISAPTVPGVAGQGADRGRAGGGGRTARGRRWRGDRCGPCRKPSPTSAGAIGVPFPTARVTRPSRRRRHRWRDRRAGDRLPPPRAAPGPAADRRREGAGARDPPDRAQQRRAARGPVLRAGLAQGDACAGRARPRSRRSPPRTTIPVERCGKLVVALQDSELPRLEAVRERAEANGVPGLEAVGPERIREIEPHAVGLRGLWSPETAIIDFRRVALALADDVRARGGTITTAWPVSSIDVRDTEVVVGGPDGATVTASMVVACAGLHADRIARLTGDDPEPRIVPFRGDYYTLTPDATALVRGLIYPVPDPRFPFLGVHFTRRIDGSVWAGPNAVLAFAREGYRRRDIRIGDLAGTLAYPGFLRLASRYLRTGLAEMWRDWWKPAFVRDLQRYVPGDHGRPADVRTVRGSGTGARA